MPGDDEICVCNSIVIRLLFLFLLSLSFVRSYQPLTPLAYTMEQLFALMYAPFSPTLYTTNTLKPFVALSSLQRWIRIKWSEVWVNWIFLSLTKRPYTVILLPTTVFLVIRLHLYSSDMVPAQYATVYNIMFNGLRRIRYNQGRLDSRYKSLLYFNTLMIFALECQATLNRWLRQDFLFPCPTSAESDLLYRCYTKYLSPPNRRDILA